MPIIATIIGIITNLLFNLHHLFNYNKNKFPTNNLFFILQ